MLLREHAGSSQWGGGTRGGVGGWACLIDGCFVRSYVHDNEVSFHRPCHVEAFIKQDIH